MYRKEVKGKVNEAKEKKGEGFKAGLRAPRWRETL